MNIREDAQLMYWTQSYKMERNFPSGIFLLDKFSIWENQLSMLVLSQSSKILPQILSPHNFM